jgi:hypothetical protein
MNGSYEKPKPKLDEFNGNPTPVNASLAERMREMLADRENLCIYDKPLQDEKVIHLKVEGGVRLLTHFYAFIFFADWRQDVWSKRQLSVAASLTSYCTKVSSTLFLASFFARLIQDS